MIWKEIPMALLKVIVILAVVGLVLWLFRQYVPMDPVIKNIIYVVVILAVIFWLLKVFGILSWLGSMDV